MHFGTNNVAHRHDKYFFHGTPKPVPAAVHKVSLRPQGQSLSNRKVSGPVRQQGVMFAPGHPESGVCHPISNYMRDMYAARMEYRLPTLCEKVYSPLEVIDRNTLHCEYYDNYKYLRPEDWELGRRSEHTKRECEDTMPASPYHEISCASSSAPARYTYRGEVYYNIPVMMTDHSPEPRPPHEVFLKMKKEAEKRFEAELEVKN